MHTPEEKQHPHLVCHRADTCVRPCHTGFRSLYFPTVYFMTYMPPGRPETYCNSFGTMDLEVREGLKT